MLIFDIRFVLLSSGMIMFHKNINKNIKIFSNLIKLLKKKKKDKKKKKKKKNAENFWSQCEF